MKADPLPADSGPFHALGRLSQARPCEIVLLIAENSIDEFIDFSLAQKHRLAQYTQGDSNDITPTDLALSKPNVLRALVLP